MATRCSIIVSTERNAHQSSYAEPSHGNEDRGQLDSDQSSSHHYRAYGVTFETLPESTQYHPEQKELMGEEIGLSPDHPLVDFKDVKNSLDNTKENKSQVEELNLEKSQVSMTSSQNFDDFREGGKEDQDPIPNLYAVTTREGKKLMRALTPHDMKLCAMVTRNSQKGDVRIPKW